MLAEERRQLIHQHLRATGSAHTAELARLFDVSVMTVWRDLGAMERSGLLRRVHGGAVARGPLGSGGEPPFASKAIRAAAEKRAIAARFAAAHLRPGLTVAIEGGSTAVAVMPHFTAKSGITLLTNSVEVARQAAAGVVVHCSGGLFRPVSQTFVGPQAIAFFAQHRADIAVISATGIDPAKGLMDPNPLEVEVKRALCGCADEIVVLADAIKWGLRSTVTALPLAEVDVLIMDAAPSASARTALRRAEVRLELARASGRG